jgi:quercetin dioxygenase-like cupin family protein
MRATRGVRIFFNLSETITPSMMNSCHWFRDPFNGKTRGPVDVVTAQVTFRMVAAAAGWHTHPGPVFVVIRSGTLSVWDEDCAKTTYAAGSVLFENGPGHSMLVKNESATVDATLYATFVVPVARPH